MMKLFDSHFHYYGEKSFADFLAPLDSTGNAYCLICQAGNYEESCHACAFAAADPRVFCACGVHPEAAEEYGAKKQDFSRFRGTPKRVAVGELGLDYYYAENSRTCQKKVFSAFLEESLQLDLPAVVHCRDREDRSDAYEDCYAMLKDFAAAGGRFDVHCFTGTSAYAEKFLALGAMIGITGIVTFKKAENVREALKIIPDDRLLIETDSPYLAPVPYRGKENHPLYLQAIAERIALERSCTTEELAELTWNNGVRFFHIPEESL